MAGEGFLTSVYAGQDIARPTFFELIASEDLMDAIHPGLKYLVTTLAQQSSSVRVLWCASRFDTAYDLFVLLLEWWHLRSHGASFAEHFFGLRRREIAPKQKLTALEAVELERRRQQTPNLTTRQRLASLVSLVFVPSLQRRCEELYREAADLPLNSRSKSQRFWCAVYPWIHAVSAFAGISFRVAYLLEQTDIWSPTLRVLRLCLVRDFPEPPALDGGPKSRLQRLREIAGKVGSGSLWSALYLMQFAQWWYARDHLLQPYMPRKVPPPPPPCPPYQDVVLPGQSQNIVQDSPSKVKPELVLLPQDRRICPLCHCIRRNPALSSSGYAFCFTCLLPHVERCGRCPVTGQATSAAQIRRIRDG